MSRNETIDVRAADATYRGWAHSDGRASFLGIRYADAPVGSLRFKPPRPAEPMPGTLVDATVALPSPPQTGTPAPAWMPRRSPFTTGEDCLNLNVFTPGCDGKRRPVIVHVFGGGFQTGSINGGYQDDLGFAERGDVVLVRPNMRTGALGFLHLAPFFGAEYSAANRGMLDLVEALRWVRRNIAAFGGDPDNVTLLGMSSGAFTIAALFGMDGIEGLFRRVWLMSGSASRIVESETASSVAADFLQQAGVAHGDIHALEALPIEVILEIQTRCVATDLGERNAPGGRTFGIVSDGSSLKRHPLEGLQEGRWTGIDIVAGWTRDEARMWYAFGIMKGPADRDGLLKAIARFHGAAAEQVLAGYEQEMPGASLAAIEERFLSETIYRRPALNTLKAHASCGGNGFAYEFAWVPQFEGGRLGSSHGFDEPFVFGFVEGSRIPLAAGDSTAQALADQMSGSLYSFARRGTPGWPPFHERTAVIRTFSGGVQRQ
jgi:para-nitrobenzyl esterase